MTSQIILPASAATPMTQTQDVIRPNNQWANNFPQIGGKNFPTPVDVYDRPWYVPMDVRWFMLRDPQMFAGYMLWKTALLVDGIQVYANPRTKDSNGKPSKSREKYAIEFAEMATYVLNTVQGGVYSKLLQLADCCIQGHKAASQVDREEKTSGQFKGKILLDRLRVMSNDDYRVRTDEFGVPVGLQPVSKSGNEDIYNLSYFARAVFRPYDDHTLGTNICWPVYEAWWERRQIPQERLANMSQFGSPSIWANSPPGVTEVELMGPNNQPLNHPPFLPDGVTPNPRAGTTVKIPINQNILAGLKAFQGNGSAMVVPDGTKIQYLQAQGSGEVFKNYSDDKSLEIIKGIFFTTSWTEQERFGSNAKGKVAASIGNCALTDGKKMLAAMISEQIIKRLIILNYGEEFADLVPEITLGNLESGALSAIYNSIAALWSTGFFDDSQRAGLCRMMSLPMPDPNSKPTNERKPTGNVLVNNQDQQPGDKTNASEEDDDDE